MPAKFSYCKFDSWRLDDGNCRTPAWIQRRLKFSLLTFDIPQFNCCFKILQAEDADLMIERMDEQIKTLSAAHKKELDNIEKAFYSERRDLLQGHKQKWYVIGFLNRHDFRKKSCAEECIFGYTALHFECRFCKKSLLQSFVLSVFTGWSVVFNVVINYLISWCQAAM